MKSSEKVGQIAKAIVAVMKEVKGIEKSMTVGTGNSSYKGVSDKDVKKEVGAAMEKHGLSLLPTEITPDLRIERWEETGQYGAKQKQQVFASVETKYILLHESGEWIEVAGYGHGVDSQDKAAGKATTYALKYAMLYSFMVPTGKIDDAETVHSDNYEAPPKTSSYNHKELSKNGLPLISNLQLKKVLERIQGGEIDVYYKAKAEFSFEKIQEDLIDKAFQTVKKQKEVA